ncbi:heme peroxidase [Mycena rosella]|uniref:Peroxidase n=1 Tax=Mycena rosella TaxID=1033263 RepID=A0AAD7G674_MYCRO|nr:heme peroxidase [Mycena rosella]
MLANDRQGTPGTYGHLDTCGVDRVQQTAMNTNSAPCPGGPRVKVYIGRPTPANVAPDGLLPSPDDQVPKLIACFADMNITIHDLMALVGTHTPAGSSASVFRLNSNVNLTHDTSTSCELLQFISNQEDWDEDHRTAHEKMSLLGQEVTTLMDCTQFIPASINLANLTVRTSTGFSVDPILLEAAI